MRHSALDAESKKIFIDSRFPQGTRIVVRRTGLTLEKM